jgi:hypothetical protein
MTRIVGTDNVIHLAMEIIHSTDEVEEKEFLTFQRRYNQFMYE